MGVEKWVQVTPILRRLLSVNPKSRYDPILTVESLNTYPTPRPQMENFLGGESRVKKSLIAICIVGC